MGHACGEIGSRNCELEYFSYETSPARGEGSYFPGESGAMECRQENVPCEAG